MYKVVVYDSWCNWDNLEKTETGFVREQLNCILETEDKNVAFVRYLDYLKQLFTTKKVDFWYRTGNINELPKIRVDYLENKDNKTIKHFITAYILWKGKDDND